MDKENVVVDLEKTKVENQQEESDQKEKYEVENKNPGLYVHKFKKPFKWGGKTYETLNFYFENLTGKDMVKVEAEMTGQGEMALSPEFSTTFQCRLAARAAKVGADMIQGLPLREYSAITTAARNFLLQ